MGTRFNDVYGIEKGKPFGKETNMELVGRRCFFDGHDSGWTGFFDPDSRLY